MSTIFMYVAHFLVFAVIWLAAYLLASIKAEDWGIGRVMLIGYLAGRIGWQAADWLVPGAW